MSIVSAPITLNELLERSGIDLKEVLVFRHRPFEPALNRAFDMIVSERPDLFECYQDCHGARTEASLLKAKYVASLIRHAPGSALFVGLYEVRSHTRLTPDEIISRPKHRELMGFGMGGVTATQGRESIAVFEMPLLPWHVEWSGKLVVRWPGLERSWVRWADRNNFEVEAIVLESLLTRRLPAWDDLMIDWNEIALMPTHWQSAIGQWRGVYLITDNSDGKCYVGSACGSENILQRWRDYAKSGHGGNVNLKGRSPANFRFAILQLVAPDLPREDVVKLESRWKLRLNTHAPAGLNAN